MIIIIKKYRQYKAGRERFKPYHSEDPATQYQPIEDKKWVSSFGPYKSIGPVPKTPQSHTIENRVCKIVPQGHWDGIKVLHGTARFCSEAAHKYNWMMLNICRNNW